VPWLVGGAPMLSKTVPAALPESTIAGGLGELQAQFDDIEIGSYPFQRGGRFGTALVLRGTDPARLEEATAAVRRLVD
ncbi:hypothetical protein R0J87_24920, partial [Halomonas sp. SIMBA_159]